MNSTLLTSLRPIASVPAPDRQRLRRPRRGTPTTAVVTSALVALSTLLLSGCGAGDNETADSSAQKAPSAGGAPASAPGSSNGVRERGSEDGARTSTSTSARVLPGGRDIVYQGRITVRVRDVARAAARAEDLALAVDGVVASEQTSAAPGARGSGEASLSLRVPPVAFSTTLDSLGALGKELGRSRKSDDVTTELADIDSRVRSQERSVARVRSLLSDAATIGEVVQVEAELARREADLESLQAQLLRLQDVTDLATIDVTLVARGTPVPQAAEQEELGFLAGLRSGWDALVGIVLVGLTVLGALLPFAVALSTVALPAYLVLRSRRRPLPAAAGETPV